MSSLLRFLAFVALIAAAVSALYFWRAYTLLAGAQTSPAMEEHSIEGWAFPAPGISSMAQMDREFQELVQRVRPSVVSITAENQVRVVQRQRQSRGVLRLPPNLGSGVIVSSDGYIVTNLHVIRGSQSIVVQLFDGRMLKAQVVGVDPLTDVAILKIDADNLQAMSFGNSDLVRPGQIVFAVGNPYGLQETVTQGIISGIGRRSTSEIVNEFFQTDTALNPGSSGGPLLNVRGEMIAINNSILAQSGGWQGISFSIPSNTAKRVFEDILDHGRVLRTWFGVAWGQHPITPKVAGQLGMDGVEGVLIEYTIEGSPANLAGIQAGDVIVKFNERTIKDGIDLRNRVAEAEVGQSVPVRLIRNGQEVDLTVRLEEFNPEMIPPNP